MNDAIWNTTDLWDNATAVSVSSEFPSWFHRLNVGVRISQGCLALMGNSLTILAVFNYEFLRTKTNLLVCNLAAADLMGGLTQFFLLLHFNLRTNVWQWLIFCTFEMTLNIFSAALNVIGIMLIAIDRFMYINFPLRYHTLVQSWHVWVAIGISWLWNISVLTLVSSFGVQASEDRVCRSATLYVNQTLVANITNGYFLCCTIITFLLYGRIAFLALKHARSIGHQLGDGRGALMALSKAETKITKMMALILGLYCICYFPQLLTLGIIRRLENPPLWLNITERAMGWVWWINSWMNPFIYAWKSRQFNRGFRLLLRLKPLPPDPAY